MFVMNQGFCKHFTQPSEENGHVRLEGRWRGLMLIHFSSTRKTAGHQQAMVLLDEHIVTTQARRLAHQHVSGVEMNCKHKLQAMMFSTFKGPFEEDIDESGAQFMRSSLFDRRAISPLYKGGMRASCACQKHSKSGNTGDLLLCVYSQMPCVVSSAG